MKFLTKFHQFLKLTIFLFILNFSNQCKIAGQQIGVCKYNSVLSNTSFCGNYISQYICVPQTRATWNYDVSYRDSVIQKIFITNIEQRLMSQYKYSSNTTSQLALSNNLDCFSAYRRFLCQWNFPSCDQNKQSQPICRSICISFFTSCSSSTEVCDIIYANLKPGLSNC